MADGATRCSGQGADMAEERQRAVAQDRAAGVAASTTAGAAEEHQATTQRSAQAPSAAMAPSTRSNNPIEFTATQYRIVRPHVMTACRSNVPIPLRALLRRREFSKFTYAHLKKMIQNEVREECAKGARIEQRKKKAAESHKAAKLEKARREQDIRTL